MPRAWAIRSRARTSGPDPHDASGRTALTALMLASVDEVWTLNVQASEGLSTVMRSVMPLVHSPPMRVCPVSCGNGRHGGLVAEGCGRLVADPLPHGDGAVEFSASDECAGVQLPGVKADWTHVVAAAGRLVALEEVWQGWAALAGDAHSGSGQSDPDGLFGQEH